MIALGVMLLLSAGAAAIWSTLVLCRANPGTTLSWSFRQPPHTPNRARLLRALAGGLSVFGAIQLESVWGYWGVLGIVAVWAPALVVQRRHNRDVTTASARFTSPR